jgi:hypothetical protein
MSYARFSYADVYVYLDVNGYLRCCGCSLDKERWDYETTADLLAHLDAHKAAGHDVPDETIELLKADAVENDAWIASVAAGMCTSCDGVGRCSQGYPQPHPAECWKCHGDGACPDCGGRGGTEEWARARTGGDAADERSGA